MSSSSEISPEVFNDRELEILRLMTEELTSREMADRLVIGVETVRWYIKQIYSKLDAHSRAEALATARRLGLLVGPTYSTTEAADSRHNLPAQLTPFIGREREMNEIRRLLGETRLLTLTGPGGTGKTRLGLRVVDQVANDFRDGAYFVGLASINDPALVAKTIAEVLDVTENANEPLVATLTRAVGGRQILLLIDNFEHVLDAAPIVTELLAATPTLKALVTSREALRVSGEQAYQVPPLTLPDLAQYDVTAFSDSEAVALFVQRARATQASFRMTEQNARDIAEICVRLDGLPLAIELAAARTNILSPRVILQRLDQRLSTLTGGARDAPARQRTLRSTIDWSYNLLDEGEKALFARLSVFHGGRTLEAIESVCGSNLSTDVLDALASLVDKSLVLHVEGVGSQPRFILLETLHEYAYERLQASGEAETFHRRQADYFVALAERAEPELHRADQLFWLDRLDEEHDNLRAALEWSLANAEAELALRLIGALGWFWHMHSHSIEGYRWALRALEQRANAVPAVRAKALHITGNRLLLDLGDYTAMRKFQEEALQIARENDDRYNLAWALLGLGLVAVMVRDYQEAERRSSEALPLFRDLDDKTGIGWALCGVGEAHRLRGNSQEAESFYQEGLELFEAMGNRRGITMMLNNMAFAAYHQHQLQRARALFQRSYALQLLVGRQEEYAYTLTGLAGIIAAQDEPERAVRLLAAADALLEAIGASMVLAEQVDYQRILDQVRAQLDESAFERLWAEGRARSLDEAMDDALRE
jgi:non-specific serine/threonine protein kinase